MLKGRFQPDYVRDNFAIVDDEVLPIGQTLGELTKVVTYFGGGGACSVTNLMYDNIMLDESAAARFAMMSMLPPQLLLWP